MNSDHRPSRRAFLKSTAALAAVTAAQPALRLAAAEKKEPFKISLAQ